METTAEIFSSLWWLLVAWYLIILLVMIMFLLIAIAWRKKEARSHRDDYAYDPECNSDLYIEREMEYHRELEEKSLRVLKDLEERGVVIESNRPDTILYPLIARRFRILDPDKLPVDLRREYETRGELEVRW